MVPIKEIHDQHHRNFIRKRSPVELWHDAFVNALAGVVLSRHERPDRAVISEVTEALKASAEAVEYDGSRETATASLYSALLRNEKHISTADKVASKVGKAILRFAERENKGPSRFSIFNSPECVYALAIGISTSKEDAAKNEIASRVTALLGRKDEARPMRSVLFIAAAIEIGELDAARDSFKHLYPDISVSRMDRTDFLFTAWLLERYSQALQAVDSTNFTALQRELRLRMLEWWTNEGQTVSAGEENGFSPLEAVILDDTLAAISSNSAIDPLDLFDQLGIHPTIVESSRSLLASGHYAQSIFEAFKRVNIEVKQISGMKNKDGKDLMANAFGEVLPAIRLNALESQSDKDEQEGFKFIYMGAMLGIRNPKAHDAVAQKDPYKTLEYLGLASLLMKRLDERESPRK